VRLANLLVPFAHFKTAATVCEYGQRSDTLRSNAGKRQRTLLRFFFERLDVLLQVVLPFVDDFLPCSAAA
jgi:hypothetical protein